jgi:serine/arginine repetitive matrix protein 2
VSHVPRRNGQGFSGLPSALELTGTERLASRGSVNFSLPTSSRPMSPIRQTRLTSLSPQRANIAKIVSPTNQHLIYDPNTRSFLPAAELLAIEQRIQDAANKQVKQKKRVPQSAGTHLAAGTAGGRPRGSAIDTMEVVVKTVSGPIGPQVQAPKPELVCPPVELGQAPARKAKKKVLVSDSESDQGSYIPNSSDTDSDVAPPKRIGTARAGQLLGKKPSVVREDREREEQEDNTFDHPKAHNNGSVVESSPSTDRTISPSPLARSLGGRSYGRGQVSVPETCAPESQDSISASQPSLETTESIAARPNGVGVAGQNSLRGGRVQSLSPARMTHFANAPESLIVKHQPPARSISPRKSALKHSSTSPRGPSPNESFSGSAGIPHEYSEASVASEEMSLPKKRSNRVSFDESHFIVGHAASPVATDSPVVPSPQSKRPWYSIGRGKKKGTTVVEDDEVMKPRPALPSFGSVRERKQPREMVEERPLVKPMEPSELPELKLSLPSPPLFTTSTGETIRHSTELLGPSSDHIVGAVLSQDAVSKNEANISKSREPLPPQVTSVEGSGYHSESDSSISDTENTKSDVKVTAADSVKGALEDDSTNDAHRVLATNSIPELDSLVEDKIDHGVNSQISEFSIDNGTATLEGPDVRGEWPDMPGGWGSSTSESSFQEPDSLSRSIVDPRTTTSPPIRISTTNMPSPKPSPATNSIMEEDEESDASIYTDAAEEISDIEGDGFLSLDAMVESPVVISPAQVLALTTPPDSPATKMAKEKASRKVQLSRKTSEPEISEGWDKVQSYWSTLSADRKRELELEAQREEDGSETEVEVKPAPKPKKKKKAKSVPTPAASQPQEAIVDSERTYMILPGARAGPNGHAVPMGSAVRTETSNMSGDGHIRKSMREDRSLRGSLRNDAPEPRGSLQKKYRPMSLPPAHITANPVEVNMHLKALSIASAKLSSEPSQRGTAPLLRRRGSGDSDSSFKRARVSSDAPMFRRSMRTSMEHDMRSQSPMRSSRFSLRSLSPTGPSFRRPFSSTNSAPPLSPRSHMRTSMRSSFSVTPSLRDTNSTRVGGAFSRSAGSKSTKLKSAGPRPSRFADSSDEEDDRPAFRSRFDSSDEDEPVPSSKGFSRAMQPAPIRSIPVRVETNDGDSSDLPDSDDDKPASAGLKLTKKRGQNGNAAAIHSQGAMLASGSLRRSGSGRETIQLPVSNGASIVPARANQTRRGSIMSILRRKKPEEGSKVRKLDMESAARRDTPLERSRSDLVALRAERPPTPKLQKRNSDGWPLPSNSRLARIENKEDGRPFTADTADGVTGAEIKGGGVRPDLGTRRFTATGLASIDVIGGAGEKRKKKFGKLRRMFGLDE